MTESEKPPHHDDAPTEKRDSVPLLLERRSSRELGMLASETDAKREPRAPAGSGRPAPREGIEASFPVALASRLGAAGLIVTSLLVLVAVFADLLASDLPIACRHQGRLFLFPNVVHPAELSGTTNDRLREQDSWALFPLVAHGPHASTDRAAALLHPSERGHPLGTDREGRDVFARVVHGTRSYLVFAVLAVAASLAFGALFGGIAGLFGGGVDALVGRLIETVSAFPPLVLVIGVQAAVPTPTIATLFLAIALTRWPEVARLVRGEVMLAATRDYVMAARALGASPLRILRRHIAPNIQGPLIVATAIGISAVVLTEASLDFLRIGPAGGDASWGETMSQFRDAPHAWWLLVFPGLFLFATVIGHNVVGEALRDALDPRTR